MPFEIDKNRALGITHYLMMGLNKETNGVYSFDDVVISRDEKTVEDRTKKNLEVVKQRIEDYGFSGLAILWYKKLLTNYNDGTFSWSYDGASIQTALTNDTKPLSFITKFYDVTNYEGIPYYTFVSLGQLLWYGILFLSIFSYIRNEYGDEIISAMKLGIIGLTLFEMIFEPRSRYLFTYAPIYVILAIYGMYCIEKKLIKK